MWKIRSLRAAAVAVAAAAWIEPSPCGTPRFSVALTACASEGRTQESHDASNVSDLLGNPTSELTYENVDGTVLELSAEVGVFRRFVVGGRLGAGGIDGGRLVDDDYLSVTGAEELGATVEGAHRWSRTHSSVDDDDLRYFDLELGWAALRPGDHRSLELFGSYGRLNETYVATGVSQIECTLPFGDPLGCAPAGSSGFAGEPVITNEVEWDAWWIGVRGWRRLGKRFRWSGSIGYAPYTEVVADDVHHLRDDLEQDPSFRTEGRGTGLQLATAFRLHLSRRFALDAGWRRTTLEADRGTLVAYPEDEQPLATRLRQVETVRGGLTLGLIFGVGR